MTVVIFSMLLVISYMFSGSAIPAGLPASRQVRAAPVDAIAAMPGLCGKRQHQRFARQCRSPGAQTERQAVTGEEPCLGGEPGNRMECDRQGKPNRCRAGGKQCNNQRDA